MTPAELSRTVRHAVCRAVEDGVLRVPVPEDIRVERPGPGGCGDWATTVALRLARPAGIPPREVAALLRDRLTDAPGIASVDITGPGFLNITLGGASQRDLVRRVRAEGVRYGQKEHPPVAPGPVTSRRAVWDETVRRLRATQGAGRETAAQDPAQDPGRAAGSRGRTPAAPVEPAAIDAALGTDALRWALLHAAAHDRPRPGGHLLRQHESNPLFTVRYAHSRTRALTRNAAALGFHGDPLKTVEPAGTSLDALIAEYPDALATAARLHAPDRLVRHLEATADAVLSFQHTVLPQGEEKPSAAHRSRLALAEAAGTVLAGGLSLLGISAPEHL
ncbi:ArgS-related anticodon-binding protein NrtL [Streptomyces sp. NPDC000594]|uniref:ArgS-related anticodon-binding protein NrtL n=1 Tax=Streptomyces sp. NPDC000594 TaxID=3154261 RepID=UPI00331C9F11